MRKVTLRAYLNRTNQSANAFARRAGIPRSTIDRLLNGGGTTVKTAKIIDLASASRVDWKLLDGGQG
jgi:predicted transcriptional regulator